VNLKSGFSMVEYDKRAEKMPYFIYVFLKEKFPNRGENDRIRS